MTALEQLLTDGAFYIEEMLQHRPEAMQDLILLRSQGQEPNVLKVIAPDTALLIRFQDNPK